MRKLGRAVSIRFGYQADKDTPATTGWVYIPFYGFTPPSDPDIQDDPLLGGANNNERDPITGVRALPAGAIRLSVPFDLAMLGHWLRMGLGNPASSTGSSPNYTHTLISGSAVLPYATFEVQWSSGDVGLYVGCMLDTEALGVAKAADIQRLDLTFQCKSWTYGTAFISGGTPAAALTALKLAKSRATVTWAGTTMGDLLDLQFTYANNLDRYNTVSGDQFPTEMDTGLATLTGSMRLRLRDRTFRNISANDGVGALGLIFPHPSDPTNLRATITANFARLTSQGDGVDGPGPIDASFNFRAEQSSGSSALTAVLKNNTVGTVYGYV